MFFINLYLNPTEEEEYPVPLNSREILLESILIGFGAFPVSVFLIPSSIEGWN
jgi:hypothetical protein